MEQLRTIRTLEELKELSAYIADKDFVAYDTETDGVDKDSRIIGFSVAADVDLGWYVILSYWDTKQEKLVDLETKQGAAAFIQLLVGKSLIMHNAPFDCARTEENFQIDLMPSVHTDTMILGHLLDENRQNGLKELGVSIFGEDARKEQTEMKESVYRNGGVLTKECYELFKADADLLARYGAKDAILTLKIFYEMVPKLYEEGLDTFFYEEESMPLLRGPTHELNTSGLRVDPDKLQILKSTLEAECLEAKAFIYKEITPHVISKYKGTGKTNTFNIGAPQQMSWLLFVKLGNTFLNLTKGGRELCKALDIKPPYAPGAKREFIRIVTENKGRVYAEAAFNPKTKKMGRPKKVADAWVYMACGKESLGKLATRYRWVEKFLEYAKNRKLLNTYVEGIQSRMRYNVIRPSFFQHGTTSGRYSCKKPNFQNLPRDDKRVKACIVSRPDNVFIGADYSQLEPRVFASFSQDERLMRCFADGDDFYSVVGVPIFDKYGCSMKKNDKNSFAKLHEDLRTITKSHVALASVYGSTAFQMSRGTGKPIEECQEIIDNYFHSFPGVYKLMLESYEAVKKDGCTKSLFGRPRRLPKALLISKIYGNTPHKELPYDIRTLLNLAVNHRIQSTGASIMNRAAIAFWKSKMELAAVDPIWAKVRIVLQVHDELVAEAPKQLAEDVADLLKYCMEKAADLPGVALVAEPKIAGNLADLK